MESKFDKVIEQYLKNNLSAVEKRKVDNWLEKTAGENTSGQLSETELLETKRRIHQQIFGQIAAEEKQEQVKIISIKTVCKIAAAILVTLMFTLLFQVKLKEVLNIGQQKTVENKKGHITKCMLADGSIVWLKGNSKLEFPVNFEVDSRTVKLQGEALFEVAKDAKHPFVINSGALVTRVLGTSFNIKNDSSNTEVTVLTGRVFLSSKNVKPVILKPYQQARFSEHKKMLIKEVQPALRVPELISGTEYDMFFNDVPLKEVIRRIEQKFEVKIRLEAPETAADLVTADLTDQSLLNSMDMVCGALSLKYIIADQLVIIQKNNTNK